MSESLVDAERQRRLSLWGELQQHGGPSGVAPHLVKELKLHRGQQGIYRDQECTRALSPTGTGVAVGVLHTGSTYADDLFDDGLIYHYPSTSRGARDQSEIASLKLCQDLQLPVFVVVTPRLGASTRDVHLGWVTDIDDHSGRLLIAFSEDAAPARAPTAIDYRGDFVLQTPRARRTTSLTSQQRKAAFRFGVLRRYGTKCGFCDITEPTLLQAAHLCSVEKNGTDDPRNGLVLCLTHHRALDEGLVRIDPSSLELRLAPPLVDFAALGVLVTSLSHLPQKPHTSALEWLWNQPGRGSPEPARDLRSSSQETK